MGALAVMSHETCAQIVWVPLAPIDSRLARSGPNSRARLGAGRHLMMAGAVNNLPPGWTRTADDGDDGGDGGPGPVAVDADAVW